jgi:protein NrfC
MATYPKSDRYITVDIKKCGGCGTCMLACTLAHEGVENPDLSRIQIVQNIFGNYPNDILAGTCRQCAKPFCVESCPTGACYIDTKHNNLRIIDETKCNGCGKCLEACPFIPSMIIWNAFKNIAMKCDLCLNAPHWSESSSGKQACVEVCPVKAIKLTQNG